jgi:bacteriocin biosynthesis cyclodehydratase domain-containing protein
MSERLAEIEKGELPDRPRLLPGLRAYQRSTTEVQIGLDPKHGVIASEIPSEAIEVLLKLDGTHRSETLLKLKNEQVSAYLKSLLLELTRLGLVEEAGPPSRHRRPAAEAGLWALRPGQDHKEVIYRRQHSAIVVQGNGRLTIALGCLLATAGIGHVQVETSGQVTEEDLGCGYSETDLGTPRRSAATAAIRRANPATKSGRITSRTKPDLVVLADTVVPAPEIVRSLAQEGITHLPVRVRDGLGIVGPLVIPGRTSCLRCADLHRTDRDASWPLVAGQLAGRNHNADIAAVTATAAMAAGQVFRVLHPDELPPSTWNATIEIDTFEGTVEQRPWTPHPACHCGAIPIPT